MRTRKELLGGEPKTLFPVSVQTSGLCCLSLLKSPLSPPRSGREQLPLRGGTRAPTAVLCSTVAVWECRGFGGLCQPLLGASERLWSLLSLLRLRGVGTRVKACHLQVRACHSYWTEERNRLPQRGGPHLWRPLALMGRALGCCLQG